MAATYFSFSKSYFGAQNPGVSNTNIGAAEPYYFNNSDILILAKAGIKLYKKWEVYFNYLFPTAVTKGGYFDFNNRSEQIGLAYFFGK